MNFSIRLTDSAIEVDFFRKNERRRIADGIAFFLAQDANVETRRRKPLRPNRLAPWELRLGDYRVFYDFEEHDKVKIVAVGHQRSVYPWQEGGTMKTLDLTRKRMTVDELLALAATDSVRIVTADGRAFVLEQADDFEKEVALLGKSKKFQRFLKERSKEAATTSLEDYRRSLD